MNYALATHQNPDLSGLSQTGSENRSLPAYGGTEFSPRDSAVTCAPGRRPQADKRTYGGYTIISNSDL